jgi:hypothetical protein
MSDGPRNSSRLEPWVGWSVVSDSPLLGLCLAREAEKLLSWDDGRRVDLYDRAGERINQVHAPDRIITAAISDDATLIALLTEGPRLILLDEEMQPRTDRPAISDATTLTVDPHGRFIAVSSKSNTTQFYNRHGKLAGRFETLQAIAHLRFVPGRPILIAASSFGSLFGIDLKPGSKSGTLSAEVAWQQRMMSNVGRLSTTGDGGIVLVSCFTHGIQRYDARGRNEGAYHLGGTAAHAVTDFPGRTIAVATTEGELAILNSAGNVRWKSTAGRGPNAIEVDALGRYFIYGLETGEIIRMNLEGEPPEPPSGKTDAEGSPQAAGRSKMMRSPDWSIPFAQTDEQAETAVLTVLADPPRVGLVTNRNRLQVFTTTGGALGQAPEMTGIGRILRTSPGWIAAATDRQIVLYDARRNGAQKLDMSLVEITHLEARPDTYGLAIVQERDRIGRATLAGRWVWKRELRSAVEDIAIGPDARLAVTSDDGTLTIYDAAGEPIGSYAADPPEAMAMVEAPPGSPADVRFITLARRFQVLRGHRHDGRVSWESPIPWEAWQMRVVGSFVIVEAPDGRALAYDGTGHQRGQTRTESAPGVFFAGEDGRVLRVVRQGMNLICSDLKGRVDWRVIADDSLGPLAGGPPGVAAIVGRSLAWFSAE